MWVISTNSQLYINISQILLLYKMWRYSNKFDSPKSLGVCYWCVKIPQCGYMEQGLKQIAFYVQQHIVAMAMCYNPALVCDKPLGAPASVKRVYYIMHIRPKRVNHTTQLKNMLSKVKILSGFSELTHCGLVMPYGDMELGQLWLR